MRERSELDKAFVKAMRTCTPKMRALLRVLPECHGQIWKAQKRLGYSSHTVHKWLRDDRFCTARGLMEQIAEREAGITRANIVLRTNHIVERCMQEVSPVLDKKGEHVFTETQDGGEALAYVFNAKGALAGLQMLAKFSGMDVNRVEVTGKNGGPIETKELSDFEKARRIAFLIARGMQMKETPPEASGNPPQTTL